MRGECTVESQPRHATCELQPNAVGNARCVWRGGATPLDLVLTSCWGRCVSVMYPRLEPSRWSIDGLLPDACASGPPPALCITTAARKNTGYLAERRGEEREAARRRSLTTRRGQTAHLRAHPRATPDHLFPGPSVRGGKRVWAAGSCARRSRSRVCACLRHRCFTHGSTRRLERHSAVLRGTTPHRQSYDIEIG